MPDTTITLGLIGAGIMGQRMLDAIAGGRDGPVRVAGIWDPSPESIAIVRERHPGLPVLDDAAAVIAAADCIYVASPPSSHLAHGRAALQAGKSFFGEKPLAIDLGDARAFVREAGDRGAINFPLATSLAGTQLRDWIAEARVGTPSRITIDVAFRTWPRPWQHDAVGWLDGRREGGFTREVVSHFVFLSRRLAGPLAGLSARVEYPADGRSERRVAASFTAGGIPVTLTGAVGETDRDESNVWLLEGDAGAVRLRDWGTAEIRMPDGSFAPAPDALPHEQARPIGLRRQLEGVAQLTRGDPHPLATLPEALDVQEMVEAILASGS